MSSPTVNEATVYEAVRVIVTPLPLDKIVGQPTTSTVNHLRQQIAKIAAAVKTTSWGGRHGHLALVLTDDEYCTVTGNPDITSDRLRSLLQASRTPPRSRTELRSRACTTSRAKSSGSKKPSTLDPTYVEELDDDYVGYSGQTIKSIWCIVTTLEKKQAAQAFHVQWDFTSHITKFARELNKQQKLCRDIGVPAAEATKIQHYVESMYASEMFDDKEMQAWEIKPSVDKTWDAAKTHFVAIYKSKEKFNAEREARLGGSSASSFFDTGSRASNNPPHFPATINSALSPADHHSLIEYTNSLEGALETATEHAAITLDNTTLLQKLEAQQRAILDQQAKFLTLLSPPNTPRQQRNRSGTSTTPPSEGRCPQRFCNSCKKDGVYHEDDDCFALDKNKDKCPSWYKPKK
eukprot:CCRYP_017206-RA/>CCRYP_017206-RA protein AED:0.39 eAED:0.39 QI:0/0/0/1/0/0/2/0/405